MAEIVQSLFGVTPQSYQQAQQQRADAQAFQYAQMSPFQQANYAIGRGANMLGGALGGQDPELQRITARQQIAQQINPNDPASIQQGIAAMQQAGDSQGAFMLQDAYRKLMESGALVGQREASAKASLAQAGRERVQAEPEKVRLAQAVAALSGFPEGSPEYNTAYAASLQEQMAKPAEKGPGFGTDREAVSSELFDKKTFAQLTPTQQAVVNARVEAEGAKIAAAGAPKLTNVMPGTKELVDIPKFRGVVQGTIDPQLKAINASDQALTAIEDSLATNNFSSFRAAQVQFARAISGAGDLSQKELKAAGADPSLLGGSADYLSSLFTSTPTADTQNKMKKTLEAIRKVASDKARTEVDQQRKIALRSPGYNPESVAEALNFPELAPRAVAAPAGVGGDLAALAAAELARRQRAKAK